MEEYTYPDVTDITDKLESNKLWIAAIICVLAGIAIGFILSPVTKGVHIALGSNNSLRNSGDGILLSSATGREKKNECCNDGGKKK